MLMLWVKLLPKDQSYQSSKRDGLGGQKPERLRQENGQIKGPLG